MTLALRALLVISRIHLPEASAASFRLDAVERAMAKLGRPVRVLTTTVPDQEADDPEGVQVSRWPALRDSSGYLRGYLPYMSFDLPLALRLLASPRPAIALVEPPPTTGVVSRIVLGARRIPYVWYAPDVWSEATEGTDAPAAVKKAVRWMESFAIRGARGVVAISDDVAERVRALGGREIHVVPNGIDTEIFTSTGPLPSEEERARIGLGQRYFVYAGTASEWQGAEIFVEGLRRLHDSDPDVQILFLGGGSAWPALQEASSDLRTSDGRPSVVFLASLPPREAAEWQRGALASLVSIRPGLGYDFAYPTKILASLACGTPVLYAGVGPATVDIRDHALGEVADYEAGAVASAMKECASQDRDPEKRAHLHQWVDDHRSIRATGQAVAQILNGYARE